MPGVRERTELRFNGLNCFVKKLQELLTDVCGFFNSVAFKEGLL